MTTATEPEIALSTAEAGRPHGVSGRTVYDWITEGVTIGGVRVRLAGYRAGGHWRVRPSDLDAFIRACNPEGTTPPPNPAKVAREYKRDKERLTAMLGEW